MPWSTTSVQPARIDNLTAEVMDAARRLVSEPEMNLVSADNDENRAQARIIDRAVRKLTSDQSRAKMTAWDGSIFLTLAPVSKRQPRATAGKRTASRKTAARKR